MKLLELRPSTVKEITAMTRDFRDPSEFVKYLESIGYTPIGHQSYFGRVFSRPDSLFVIKVSVKSDSGYIQFAKYAINNQNDPHMPKLKLIEFKTKKGGSYFVSFIEKLEEFNPASVDNDFVLSKVLSIFATIANGNRTLDKQLVILKRNDFYNEIIESLRKNKSLFFSMNKLRKAIPDVQYDTKLDNFMKRKNGTIVIVDPVSPLN